MKTNTIGDEALREFGTHSTHRHDGMAHGKGGGGGVAVALHRVLETPDDDGTEEKKLLCACSLSTRA